VLAASRLGQQERLGKRSRRDQTRTKPESAFYSILISSTALIRMLQRSFSLAMARTTEADRAYLHSWGGVPSGERKGGENTKRRRRFFFQEDKQLPASRRRKKILSNAPSLQLELEKKNHSRSSSNFFFSNSLSFATMPRFSVGLDVGTQGAKAVVFDLDSKRVVSRGEWEEKGKREKNRLTLEFTIETFFFNLNLFDLFIFFFQKKKNSTQPPAPTASSRRPSRAAPSRTPPPGSKRASRPARRP
jgi:hypothetical protein